MAELADAYGSGPYGATRGGSSPLVSTTYSPPPGSTGQEHAPSGKDQDPDFVWKVFASISRRYDLANHVLSGGVDFFWRKKAVRLIARGNPRSVLDLATGSGDLALALEKALPDALIVGADFCHPMLEEARRKGLTRLVVADGLAMPFPANAFDALTVAFGLRNMASWRDALADMVRVLKPGGVLLVMDFSLPRFPPFRWLYRKYLHHFLPHLAGWLTGQRDAYQYLGESIERFPKGEAMAALFLQTGLIDFQEFPLCGGIAAIYLARKA